MIQNLSGRQVTADDLHTGFSVFQFKRGQFDQVSGAVIDINREIHASEVLSFRQHQKFQPRRSNAVQTLIRRVITMGSVNVPGDPQVDLAARVFSKEGVAGDRFKGTAIVFSIGKRSCMRNYDPPFGTTAFRRSNDPFEPLPLLLEVFREIIVVGF